MMVIESDAICCIHDEYNQALSGLVRYIVLCPTTMSLSGFYRYYTFIW